MFFFSYIVIMPAQVINVPDSNLKTVLVNSSSTSFSGQNQQGINITIDTNNNNEIEQSEALQVYRLYINNAGITDLTGLEYFLNLNKLYCNSNLLENLSLAILPNLEVLDCSANNLTNLNINSAISLKELYCNDNQLTSLDVTNCTELKQLFCNSNQLTTLDIANLSLLEVLSCSQNFLTQLLIDHAPHLEELNCSSNSLTSLNLSGITVDNSIFSFPFQLNCSNNNLSQLDTSGIVAEFGCRVECSWNPSLTFINVMNGAPFYIDTLKTPPFANLYFGGSPNLLHICVDDFNIASVQSRANQLGYTNCVVDASCLLSNTTFDALSSIILTPNPAITVLNIDVKKEIEVTSYTIYNTLGQLIVVIPNVQQVKTIDVSTLKTGNYFLKVNSNKGSSILMFIKQ